MLITLISKPNSILPEKIIFPLTITTKLGQATLKGDSLKDDIDALNGTLWNWQQFLRALATHGCDGKTRLKRLYLMGSKESATDLPQCKGIAEQYFSNIEVSCYEMPIDFENVEEVMGGFSRIVKAERGKNTPDRDIVIDVTGGQKTASIAAALITLTSKITFQYVQTNPPYGVIAYDVISEVPFTLSG